MTSPALGAFSRRILVVSHNASRRTLVLTPQHHRLVPAATTFATTNTTTTATTASHRHYLSTEAPAKKEEGETEEYEFSSPRVKKLFDKISVLPRDEVRILGPLIIQILGLKVFPGEFGGPVMGGGGGDAAAAVEEEEPQEAKTIFDVKLVGFDAKAKIKVIKEVRALTGLGLKEAKELVESAPKVLSKDVKQEAAEEIKEKLESIGGQVEIV